MENIAVASQMHIDLSTILNPDQMKLMMTYKEIYNYDSNLSFFLLLIMMSHFAQGSFFTHYSSPDHRPVQLYLWLLGSSGL